MTIVRGNIRDGLEQYSIFVQELTGIIILVGVGKFFGIVSVSIAYI